MEFSCEISDNLKIAIASNHQFTFEEFVQFDEDKASKYLADIGLDGDQFEEIREELYEKAISYFHESIRELSFL